VLDEARNVHALDLADDAELQDAADQRIVVVALQRLRERQGTVRLAPVGLLQRVHQRGGVANAEPGEIDDDVVPLRGALLIKRRQGDRVHHQVSVVGDELERHRSPARVGDGQFIEPRHAGGQDAEPVLARQHLEERRIGHVDQGHVAEEPVGVKNVEEQLAGLIEGGVGDDEVHVEIHVAVVQQVAARQPQIDAVVVPLVAAIGPAVHVDHADARGSVAWVLILSRRASVVLQR